MLQSSALIIGAGGLGSTIIMYLAAAGLGQLAISQRQRQRQIENCLLRSLFNSKEKDGMNMCFSCLYLLCCHFVCFKYIMNGKKKGKLGIVDSDLVECNNLHRQVIHSEKKEVKFLEYSCK